MKGPEKYEDLEKDVDCWLKDVKKANKIFQQVKRACPEIEELDPEQLEWLYYGN